jgi:trehalose synthase
MTALVELKTTTPEPRKFADYEGIIEPELYAEVLALAAKLQGKRWLQVNSTAQSGGVAEILASTIPLLRDLGIDVSWQVIKAPPEFFEITKSIHNGLQGDRHNLTAAEWDLFDQVNRELAAQINPSDWDAIMIHDPQPAAVPGYLPATKVPWLWRYHGDSSAPNPSYRNRILTYLKPYSGAVFSMPEYVLPGYKSPHIAIIPPAIDPLSVKNQPMEPSEARDIVASFGVNPHKPLIVQVSRFDPWKDPLGVVEAWREAKVEVPDLQLAMVGNFASDDPEGERILAKMRVATMGVSDLFIIANKADDRATKAFQTAATVVLQKSLKEGFGLTVTEALWAGTPVIGGNVGGIVIQIENRVNGFLVNSIAETTQRIVELVSDPTKAAQMGVAGREIVRQKFLTPRLIRDDLKLLIDVIT